LKFNNISLRSMCFDSRIQAYQDTLRSCWLWS